MVDVIIGKLAINREEFGCRSFIKNMMTAACMINDNLMFVSYYTVISRTVSQVISLKYSHIGLSTLLR